MNYFIIILGVGLASAFRPIQPDRPLFSRHLMKNTPYGSLENMPLSDLYKQLDTDTIQNIYLSNDLKDIYVKQNDITQVVHSNPILTDNLLDIVIKNNIPTSVLEPVNNYFEIGGHILTGIMNIAFVTISISIIYNLFGLLFLGSKNNQNGGPMGGPFPFSKPKDIVDKSSVSVRLSDWAGSPEVFEECFEIVSYIQNASIYEAAGATIPKGILLDGPPGTGKTLLAKAIAGETNATFISMSGSEFVELYVGMGAVKVRQLFQQARESAPSIIFIDEIDAVGKKRSVANAPNSNDEREQTLNQILSEMDGFQPNKGVIVIAATNRRDILDDALLRPGRFDRLVYVPLPDRSSRSAILSLYLKNKTVSDDICIDELAEGTAGFSGAQIKNFLNEAAIFAARSGSTIVTKKNLDDALEKIIVGITKKVDSRSLVARTRVAIHELGHAILAGVFKDDFILKKVSLKSSYSGMGGYTLFSEYPEMQDAGLYTREHMLKRITVAMGGKAAETLAYGAGEVSVGASEDLKEANNLARQMVERFGMGGSIPAFSRDRSEYSEGILQTIDNDVLSIMNYCFTDAQRILLDHKNASDVLLVQLLHENVLDGETVLNAIHK